MQTSFHCHEPIIPASKVCWKMPHGNTSALHPCYKLPFRKGVLFRGNHCSVAPWLTSESSKCWLTCYTDCSLILTKNRPTYLSHHSQLTSESSKCWLTCYTDCSLILTKNRPTYLSHHLTENKDKKRKIDWEKRDGSWSFLCSVSDSCCIYFYCIR